MGTKQPEVILNPNPMISVVTAYFNRKELFMQTLETMATSKVSNFEIVAVDDGSDENQRLEQLQRQFAFLRVVRLEKKNKWYSNPCIPFNIGLRASRGEVIIMQNPECLHQGDILDYVQKEATPGAYLSFACFSLSQEQTRDLTTVSNWRNDFSSKVQTLDTKPLRDGDSGWYNHSIYNPRAYHFCSAIMREDLSRLGGFDERYAGGVAFDDDELLHRIRMAGLNIRIVDSPFVYHQHHYSSSSNAPNAEQILRLERNKKLFFHLTLPSTCYRANGDDWGNQNEQSAREVNREIESILLGSSSYIEKVQISERWMANSKLLADTIQSGEMLTLIQSSLSFLGMIIERRRSSLVGKFLWRSRFERLWIEFLKNKCDDVNFDEIGKKSHYLKLLSKSAKSLNLLMLSVSSFNLGNFLIPIHIRNAIERQAQTITGWCRKLEKIKPYSFNLKH